MKLKKLNLLNFKNYDELTLRFSDGVNCLVGNNGVGKTNVMDAIYYLSFCKSYFNAIDSQNIKHDQGFFSIQGEYEREGRVEKLFCGLKRKQKKQFKRNKKEYSRIADHIGLFPLVMISPTDGELITEGSEVRRKLMDGIISQFNQRYLEALLNYNKALMHRNALLKQFAFAGNFSVTSLELWNEQLIRYGALLHKERLEFIGEFQPYFERYYALLGNENEEVKLDYQSQLLATSFDVLLDEHLSKDRKFQHSTAGIHKDDWLFQLNGMPIKKFGSQGQQKTFLLALKLGQAAYIGSQVNIAPILLLDDIYDKLDVNRVRKLAEIASGETFGQVFITDAHPERSRELFANLNSDVKLFDLPNPEPTNDESKAGTKALETAN
jgi:DNA replication and repair protein RecF